MSFFNIGRTPNNIGIAKDKFGLRPGVMVETDEIFAVASEEMALLDVVDSEQIEQIAPGEQELTLYDKGFYL